MLRNLIFRMVRGIWRGEWEFSGVFIDFLSLLNCENVLIKGKIIRRRTLILDLELFQF